MSVLVKADMRTKLTAGLLAPVTACAVIGLMGVVTAPVSQAASEAAVGGPVTYAVPNQSDGLIRQSLAEVTSDPALLGTIQSDNSAVSRFVISPYVLAGDTVAWSIGMAFAQDENSNGGFGFSPSVMTLGPSGYWAYDPGWVQARPLGGTALAALVSSGQQTLTVDYLGRVGSFTLPNGTDVNVVNFSTDNTPNGVSCGDPSRADTDPVVNGTNSTQWNHWCMGIGAWLVTAPNAQPLSASDYTTVGAIQVQPTPIDNRQAVSGPENNWGQLNLFPSLSYRVVNPKLWLVKEVCASGTGCDVNDDPAIDALAKNADGTLKINADGSYTYTDNGGEWIKETELAADATDVQWRLTAINPGNITMDNVTTLSDELTGDTDDVDTPVAGPQGACGDMEFGSVASQAGVGLICDMPVNHPLVDGLLNTAQLEGDFDNTITDANGQPLIERFDNSKVASNKDSARVLHPGLKLTKWVCSIYDATTGAPACATPTGTVLTTLAGITGPGRGGYAATQGQPAGGWVKETTIPYGATADWLMVATNIGTMYLSNVTLTDATSGDGQGTTAAYSPASVSNLAPGQSAVFRTSTTGITNFNAAVSGDDGTPVTVTSGEYSYFTGEPTYNSGADVVNSAQAQGIVVADAANTPYLNEHGQPIDLVVSSNPSTAEVNAVMYAVGDYVWVDVNRDGVQDAGEPPVAGVTVALLDGSGGPARDVDGNLVASTVTDGNGYYYFDRLPAGQYQVMFTLPDGYRWTLPLAGLDETVDSDAVFAVADTDATAASGVFTLGPSDANLMLTADLTTPYRGSVVAPMIDPTIDAGVVAPVPGIKLTKWVCSTGDDCPVPSGAELTAMAGVGSRNSDGTWAVTDSTAVAQPTASGWVRQAALAYDGPVKWLLVATNIGNTVLSDVTVSADVTTGAGLTTTDPTGTVIAVALASGSSATLVLNSADLTNVGSFGAGVNGTADWSGESVWDTSGSDVVNTATVSATPMGSHGSRLRLPDGTLMPAVVSNPSSAEARTTAPAPALKVTKWVCVTGTGCVVPPSAADLTRLSGVSVNAGVVSVVTGQPTAEWVKETTVDPGGSAQWLMVVSNIGDTAVTGISVCAHDVAVVAGTSPVTVTSCVDPGASVVLTPGASTFATALVENVTTTAPWVAGDDGVVDPVTREPTYNNGDDVVNSAFATATAVDSAGHHLPRPNGQPGDTTVTSNTSTAEVTTPPPPPPTPTYAVGDFVWVDANSNGVQDAGETPVAGVTVSLVDAAGHPVDDVDGTPVASTTTDADGYYFFDRLPAGQYQVVFTLPDGYRWTTPLAGSDAAVDSNAVYATAPTDATAGSGVFTLGPSDTNLMLTADLTTPYRGSVVAPMIDPTIDAGVVVVLPPPAPPVPTYAVGDFVWVDANSNGVQDAGEAGLPGVTVTLQDGSGSPAHDVDGNPVASTVTDSAGYYYFDRLPAGQYQVVFTLPDGYRWTMPMASGSTDANDSNAVYTTSATDATAGSGVFTLDSSDANLMLTADLTTPYRGSVVAPMIDPTIDAGVVVVLPPPAPPTPTYAVGDFVWVDANSNGVQDAGEAGLPGVTVNLLDSAGTVLASMVTDAAGYYHFDGLPAGTYQVGFVLPDGYAWTVYQAGSDVTVDSDADVVTGLSPRFTLGPAGSNNMVAPGDASLPSDYTVTDAAINPTIDAGLVVVPPPTPRTPPPTPPAAPPAPPMAPTGGVVQTTTSGWLGWLAGLGGVMALGVFILRRRELGH